MSYHNGDKGGVAGRGRGLAGVAAGVVAGRMAGGAEDRLPRVLIAVAGATP